jgi:hypothetical protein
MFREGSEPTLAFSIKEDLKSGVLHEIPFVLGHYFDIHEN